MLKPASETLVSAVILTDVIASTGIPMGADNFIPGHGSAISDVFVDLDQRCALPRAQRHPPGQE